MEACRGPQRKGLVQRFRGGSRLPPVPLHRRRRRGAQLAARLRGGQHGPALESGDSGATDRAVHRLGQQRPVSVINYVAQGTIEHGMLSLIDFKKSVFSGVLDGGSDEVFLGGSRLKNFMETVERASGSIPAAMPLQEAPATAPEAISDAQVALEETREDAAGASAAARRRMDRTGHGGPGFS